MTTFHVWAPDAGRVELLALGRAVAMHRRDGGWWSVDVEGAEPGTDYLLSVDGRGGVPDPRSPWQPAGVHGPSRVIDHTGFRWTDDAWQGMDLPSSVLYELHVGTFSEEGTFDGAVAHLDHLCALGVTAVELLPVAEFSGVRGWGYDGVNLYAPHHAYGGPAGLKRLVDACHSRGLGVVLDVVFNHLGPEGNHLGTFGPYLNERASTPWGAAVNLDGRDSYEVRRYFVDNALMWLRDYHLDGLRLDAVHALVDASSTHFLEELAVRVDELGVELGRPLALIAESDLNDPRIVQSRQVGGRGLDACWSDEFHHALQAALAGDRAGYYQDFGSLECMAKALRQSYVHDGTWSAYRQRVHGRPLPEGLDGHRFVVCLQSHDQVGNRPEGDRTAALMSVGRLKVGGALLLTSPFVPMLFQGEEWGASTPFQYFTDHADPRLVRLVAEGRGRDLAHFGWSLGHVPDPQDRATFQRSKLRWDELTLSPHDEILEWHRRLIQLRRQVPALRDGRMDRVSTTVEEGRWLVMRRGTVTVACNLDHDAVALNASGSLLAASDERVFVAGGSLHLPADSVAVLEDGLQV